MFLDRFEFNDSQSDADAFYGRRFNPQTRNRTRLPQPSHVRVVVVQVVVHNVIILMM